MADYDFHMEDDAVVDADPNRVRVVNVDVQSVTNGAVHHCEKYEVIGKEDCLVVRRGGLVTLTVTLSKPINCKSQHEVKLIFAFGQRPNVSQGTLAPLVVSGAKQITAHHGDWGVCVAEEGGSTVKLKVQVPTDAPVGEWRLSVEARRRDQAPATCYTKRLNTKVYILFNPWNENDGTYLPEEERRTEYVLNDVGKVFVGSFPHTRGRHWVFGQFDNEVLPACILLLERSGLSAEARADPVRVSRVVTKMVNSSDDGGVLAGNWSGSYEDGIAPGEWTGSIKILESYMRTRKPVKYGQCWVFACVVNTVCRCLGLPCRVVTNFASAHDTNVSLSIDEYIDEDGDEIEVNNRYSNPGGINDSIWNFHVWNDVWMTRPDLPDGFAGWQAIDATPQETSDGAYQCGPASHAAIMQGRVELKYDVPFILAEVNADVVRWQKDDAAPGGFKKISSNKSNVGRQMLTKKVGRVASGGFFENDKEDVTWDYKPPEGTRAERVSILCAARRCRNARAAYDMPAVCKEDVCFTIEDRDQVPIGEHFNFKFTAKNNSTEQRTISMVMTATSIYYTGAKAHGIKRKEGEIVLMAGESKTETLEIYYSDYYTKLVDHDLIKGMAICTVKETSYSWAGSDKLEIIKPDIKIEVLTDGVQGKPLPVKFSFDNPLPLQLKKGRLVVDGPGLLRPKTIPIDTVGAKACMSFQLKLVPRTPVDTTLVATFNCGQLYHLHGSVKVQVVPK